ncbi:TetR/AcrR family transcriptional regulator [Amycolatopsis endophytica]|uniref:AcrR family transcriptional regulator n=1 Tax=Amycolatopsis endophytica TaxID=860233 RepID=A0A853AZZ1_9PSEU|nr:TetR family transcriptional regulator [Amycolatopsis endophytica]NYI88373.1 AcrR family transcriptional regulator [Amycolatopsis endophytica]
MGRWEPNARERLSRAALELFTEHGYDSTTVAEIAERAGLTKRTFFRYFADKREVLFAGQDGLSRIIAEKIIGADGSASPLEAIGAGLEGLDVIFADERRQWARQRHDVITGNDELRERELLKSAAIATALAAALRERGVPDLTAELAAEAGNLAFRTSFTRWIEPSHEQGFAEVVRQTIKELQAAVTHI